MRGRLSGAAVGNRPAMPAIPDDHVVRVLRPFVAATGPVLRGLRGADPFRLGRLARRRALELQESAVVPRGGADEPPGEGRPGRAHRARPALDRLATSKLPGTPRRQTTSPEERDDWWVSRVGRFTSIVASNRDRGRAGPPAAGVGHPRDRRAGPRDLRDRGRTRAQPPRRAGAAAGVGAVRARRRPVPPRATPTRPTSSARPASSAARWGRRRRSGAGSRPWPGRCGGWGPRCRACRSELDRRPKGNRAWRTLANVPVVGAVGSYRSERSGLKRAARAAARWVAREQRRRHGGEQRRSSRGRSGGVVADTARRTNRTLPARA